MDAEKRTQAQYSKLNDADKALIDKQIKAERSVKMQRDWDEMGVAKYSKMTPDQKIVYNSELLKWKK